MRVFSYLSAKTKTEGGKSYLQFGASIKMQIVGSHFSAVTMEALSLQRPKTPRRMDPPESTTQNSLSLNRSTEEKDAGFLFFLSSFIFVLCHGSTGADVRPTSWRMCHCCEEWVKVCQSIRRYKMSFRKKSRGTDVLEKKDWNILLMKEATFSCSTHLGHV